MSKKNADDLQLLYMKRTRPRTPMPRPVIFKSKKGFDRNRDKDEVRKLTEEDYDDE